MGLLDFFGDPQANMAMAAGLLGGGNFGTALGRGLAGGQAMQISTQEKRLREAQANDYAMRAERAKQEQAQQQAIRDAALESYISPDQANAMSMGPGQGTMSSGFNPRMFVDKVMQIDPLRGMEYRKAFTPEPQINKLDAKDFTPASVQRFHQTGNYADLVRQDKLHFQDTGGGVAGINPFTGEKVSEVQKTGNPFSDLVLRDANGNIIPNTPLVGVKTNLAQAGATRVNNHVSIAGPENAHNKIVGEGLAKDGLDLVNAAKTAPSAIQTAQRIREVLDSGAITGTGADVRLAMNKALATAGLIDGKTVANTQQLMSDLNKITLGAIKTSGLGSGQGFTDKDRQFLADSVSGTIDSTPANLRRSADLYEKAARMTYRKGEKVLSRWKENPSLKAVAQDTELDPLPLLKLPPNPTASSLIKGEKYDLGGGRVGLWDGMGFKTE